MRIIVTGGGTGGHIYPAIAIADKFREMEEDCQVLYLGNKKGIESEVVPKAGYEFRLVDARWFARKKPLELIKTGMTVLKGVMQAKKIMKEFNPDVVIGTGGYVCFPVILAAKLFGAKAYIHEQNAFPGMANKKLEPYVEKIFLGFEAGGKYFKNREKLVASGNPVRKSFFDLDKDIARDKIGISKEDFVIFTFGGSLGAEKINEAVYELAKEINGKEGITLVFGTGKWYFQDVLDKFREEGLTICDNIRVKDYIDNMDSYLTGADVVVSRAGALSVAETTVCGKASILIPSPNVTGNHQFYNAKAVSDKGGAILIEEKDFSADRLKQEIYRLRENPEEIERLSEASKEAAPLRALEIIYETIKADLRK